MMNNTILVIITLSTFVFSNPIVNGLRFTLNSETVNVEIKEDYAQIIGEYRFKLISRSKRNWRRSSDYREPSKKRMIGIHFPIYVDTSYQDTSRLDLEVKLFETEITETDIQKHRGSVPVPEGREVIWCYWRFANLDSIYSAVGKDKRDIWKNGLILSVSYKQYHYEESLKKHFIYTPIIVNTDPNEKYQMIIKSELDYKVISPKRGVQSNVINLSNLSPVILEMNK